MLIVLVLVTHILKNFLERPFDEPVRPFDFLCNGYLKFVCVLLS